VRSDCVVRNGLLPQVEAPTAPRAPDPPRSGALKPCQRDWTRGCRAGEGFTSCPGPLPAVSMAVAQNSEALDRNETRAGQGTLDIGESSRR
jgi:hypothetical protein